MDGSRAPRSESSNGRPQPSRRLTPTVAANSDHVKHEVCAQDKRIISSVVSSPPGPGASAWQQIPCDIM